MVLCEGGSGGEKVVDFLSLLEGGFVLGSRLFCCIERSFDSSREGGEKGMMREREGGSGRREEKRKEEKRGLK